MKDSKRRHQESQTSQDEIRKLVRPKTNSDPKRAKEAKVDLHKQEEDSLIQLKPPGKSVVAFANASHGSEYNANQARRMPNLY
jgi:hypothetical protein